MMQLLYLFESIRTPWLDSVMQAVTELGSEIAFLVVALIMFWCVDKKKAYYLISVGFIGTVTSQVMKMAFQIPRPWVRDPGFSIVESARADATGYSFPSGHSQSAVGTFGAVAATTKQKWLRVVCILIAILVPISRMYLGVHTPADVVAGACICIILLIVLQPICLHDDGKHLPKLFIAMVVLAFGFVAYAEFFPFPADIDAENLASARKNAYTLLGTMCAMAIVFFVDEKKLHFPVHGKWYAQAAKIAGGLAIVIGIKVGLAAPLESLCNGHLIGRSIQYMLIVLAAGIVWPLTFPWFSKLGTKEK